MFTAVLATNAGGFPVYVVPGLTIVLVAVIVALVMRSRSKKAHAVAATEEGVVLTVTTLPTAPSRKQYKALQAAFSGSSAPSNGYQRPIAVLDAQELRLTRNGAAATAFLRIPRTAIAGVAEVEARDRLMKARAIRLTISTAGGPLPLDLVPLDPSNPTTVAAPIYVVELAARLRGELGLVGV